jgi:branched-chain amino acid transport system ATP-binding protein
MTSAVSRHTWGKIPMLKVEGLTAGYGEAVAIREISLQVDKGEIVALVGANGAGKSTTLRAISGVVRPMSGTISFEGKRIDSWKPHEIVRRARIAHIPEGRQLFGKLSVADNIMLGAYTLNSPQEIEALREQVFTLFPRLAERRTQRADTLSGGEQQMLAIARGLMIRPKLLMLDEPSLGLMPTLISNLWQLLRQLRGKGYTILLVEQNVRKTLQLADRAYVLRNGRIILQGAAADLVNNDLVRQAYLGI